MKQIIAYGCSYGEAHHLNSEHIREKNKYHNIPVFGHDDFSIVSTSFGSHGVGTIRHFLFNTIDYWIKKFGKDNIFILIQVSELTRNHYFIPQEFLNNLLSAVDPSPVDYRSDLMTESDYKELNHTKIGGAIFGIDGRYVWNPPHLNLDLEVAFKDAVTKKGVKRSDISDVAYQFRGLAEEYMKNVDPVEDRVIKSIYEIISIQKLLDSVDVDYGFIQMKDLWHGYMPDNSGQHFKENWHIHNLLRESSGIPNELGTTLVKYGEDSWIGNHIVGIDHLLSQIKWDRFFFYKKDELKTGGIDEYASDVFGLQAYAHISDLGDNFTDAMFMEYVKRTKNIPAYGYHPDHIAHCGFIVRAFNQFFNLGVSNDKISNLELDLTNSFGNTNLKDKHLHLKFNPYH